MTTRPNGSVFKRAHVVVDVTRGAALLFYALCSCPWCAGVRARGNWAKYVSSISHREAFVDPYELPPPETVSFADLADGDFFSNAAEPETLFVKRQGSSSGPGRLSYTAVWVHNPDGDNFAGTRCYIEPEREVIPREVSFQFD